MTFVQWLLPLNELNKDTLSIRVWKFYYKPAESVVKEELSDSPSLSVRARPACQSGVNTTWESCQPHFLSFLPPATHPTAPQNRTRVRSSVSLRVHARIFIFFYGSKVKIAQE